MKLHLNYLAIITCLLFTLGQFSLARGAPSFQAAALSGQAAPGTGGRSFSFFYPPTIGNSGHVLIPGWLTGVTSNDEGLWSGLPGAVVLVAREGSPAPGTTAFFGQNSWAAPCRVNSSGMVAFSASLTGPGVDGTNNTGIWAGQPGAVTLVVRAGSPAPGMPPGVVFAGALQNWLMLNDVGELLIRGALAGPGIDSSNDFGFWAGPPGALQLVAREGDVAPGTGGGILGPFSGPFVDPPVPVLNAAGQVAFAANHSGGRGIWRWNAGALELVARTGSTAFGMSGTFADVRDPWMNASGEVVFVATPTGEGIDFTNNRGIWAGVPGAVELVVRKGNPAPGSPGNYLVLNADSVGIVSIDDGGFVTFPSSLVDSDGAIVPQVDGIWQYGGSGPGTWPGNNLALDGTPAPGLPLLTLTNSSVLGPHPTGSVPFLATLVGTGVSDACLWLKDGAGPPTLIVREGTLFDIGGGVMRSIGGITASNTGPCYNASRQMVIGLNFVGGTSGIFVSNIPAPATPGDMNCDGAVNTADVPHFADALLGAPSFGGCEVSRADMNADSAIDGRDAQPFIAALLAQI